MSSASVPTTPGSWRSGPGTATAADQLPAGRTQIFAVPSTSAYEREPVADGHQSALPQPAETGDEVRRQGRRLPSPWRRRRGCRQWARRRWRADRTGGDRGRRRRGRHRARTAAPAVTAAGRVDVIRRPIARLARPAGHQPQADDGDGPVRPRSDRQTRRPREHLRSVQPLTGARRRRTRKPRRS